MIKYIYSYVLYLQRNIFESCMIKYIYLYLRTYIFLVMHDYRSSTDNLLKN
jgi:hypothetical protein